VLAVRGEPTTGMLEENRWLQREVGELRRGGRRDAAAQPCSRRSCWNLAERSTNLTLPLAPLTNLLAEQPCPPSP
jgi:hypothetical protein